jgi:hypothetical protein
MKTLALVSALGLALFGPLTSHASDKAEQAASARTGKPVTAATPVAANNQTAVACNFCYTCGGDWPVFAGFVPTTTQPYERGSSCSGPLQNRTDSSPYLCCR